MGNDTLLPMHPACKKKLSKRSGSLMIDALLAIVIFGSVVAAFATGTFQSQHGVVRGNNRMRATYLVEEGLEAVRTIRNGTDGFATIFGRTLDQTDGVNLTSGAWTITDASTTVDSFYTRSILFSAGSNTNERVVTCTVSWTDPGRGTPHSISMSSYITNWQTDLPPDAPQPDWSTPILVGNITNANENFQAIAIQGDYAYVVGKESTQPGLYIYDISEANIAAPPLETSLTSNFSAYDIAVSGNYAYVATGDFGGEVKIIDITARPLVCCTASIDLLGSRDIKTVAVSGSTLYIGAVASIVGSELFRYDVSTPSSPTADGSFNDDALNMYSIALYGTGAFVAADDPGEIKVFDITKTPNPEDDGGADVSSPQSYSVALVLTGAFIGTQYQNGSYEVFSFDTSNCCDPLVGSTLPNSDSLDLGGVNGYGTVHDIASGTGYALGFLATGKRVDDSPDPDIKHPFIVMDFSDVRNISSLYDGNILDAIFTGSLEEGTGIAVRNGDQTVFIVGGSPPSAPPGFTQGDLAVLRPTWP
jgi:hypothetical protein